MSTPTRESIPGKMQGTYNEIVALIDGISAEYLDEEYAVLAHKVTAKLARKRPSPLEKGKPEIWACGILFALGKINFLFDKTQTPHMKPDELCALFRVKLRTIETKANLIMNMLDTGPLDPRWFRPSHVAENPMVWLLQSSDGFVFDVRTAPREVQEEAFKSGLIPFIPDDQKPG